MYNSEQKDAKHSSAVMPQNRLLSAFFALFKRPCKHLFRGKEMQTRDENGMVKWQCCKCKKVFVAECGLDILKHGKCDGVW